MPPSSSEHAFSVAGMVPPLTGLQFRVAVLLIGLGNFLSVLDTTIANVSVPTIAGSVGVSSTQGTWVITSYAVAEAITVPLTGFLTKRIGAKRLFVGCYIAFGLISLGCGLSSSLGMLLFFRVLLGISGGPLCPLSQTLLLELYPREKATQANVLWSVTTLIGPVIGPILGGIICDDYGWPWIFYIKVPIAAIGGLVLLVLFRGQPDPTEKASVDRIGLLLLIIWVAALQILLDNGRNVDWFASPEIQILAVVSAVGFVAFIIWELTDPNPIVDLRIYRYLGFTVPAFTLVVGFGAFFASLVLLPLWLQTNMGYTATWAGYATGIMGILSLTMAPLAGKMAEKIDPRLVVCFGLLGLASIHIWRMSFNPEVTFLQMAWPTFFTGPFLVMFIVPVTGLCMKAVPPEKRPTAAGMANFMRALASSFAVSLIQTGWSDAIRTNQTELAGAMKHNYGVISGLIHSGAHLNEAVAGLTMILEEQSVMLATLNMFGAIALVFLAGAVMIWFCPKISLAPHPGHSSDDNLSMEGISRD